MKKDDQTGLLLLGIGGGGSLLVAAIKAFYGAKMRAICIDTDALSSRELAPDGVTCLLLGGSRLNGHGAGGDAVQGRLAAQDDMRNLVPQLEGVRTVVIIACLGAGTGGGVTPEIVKMLHDMGIAVLCFVTMPFAFEGDSRRKAAERVLPLIEENADSLVIIPLDDLFKDVNEALLSEALKFSERFVAAGVTLLWRLITNPGFIQLDAERLHNMVLHGGMARFSFSLGQGEDRARKAMEMLCNSCLLQKSESLVNANALMIGILAGKDLRLDEISEIMKGIRKKCKAECHLEMGTVLDQTFEGRIELVALVFESWTAAVKTDVKMDGASALESASVESFPIQPGNRKGRVRTSKLSFGVTGRGKFQNVESTLYLGMDLDVPTYYRRNITLDR